MFQEYKKCMIRILRRVCSSFSKKKNYENTIIQNLNNDLPSVRKTLMTIYFSLFSPHRGLIFCKYQDHSPWTTGIIARVEIELALPQIWELFKKEISGQYIRAVAVALSTVLKSTEYKTWGAHKGSLPAIGTTGAAWQSLKGFRHVANNNLNHFKTAKTQYALLFALLQNSFSKNNVLLNDCWMIIKVRSF